MKYTNNIRVTVYILTMTIIILINVQINIMERRLDKYKIFIYACYLLTFDLFVIFIILRNKNMHYDDFGLRRILITQKWSR